jgi:hypothetical protein
MDKMNGNSIPYEVMKQGVFAEKARRDPVPVDLGPGGRYRCRFVTRHQGAIQELKDQ